MTRWAKRRDANERVIIDALVAAGTVVTQLDQPLDLLCLHRGRFLFMEVKNPARQSAESLKKALGVPAVAPGGEWSDMGERFGPRAKMLLLTQARWIRANWAGEIYVVLTPVEAVDFLHNPPNICDRARSAVGTPTCAESRRRR